MRAFVTLAATCLVAISAVAGASNANTCNAHVSETCQELGSDWTEGSCNSLFGGFKGNSANLHQLMLSHFEDSFKLLLTVKKSENCKKKNPVFKGIFCSPLTSALTK